MEVKTLLMIADKHIIPAGFSYLKDIDISGKGQILEAYSLKYKKGLEDIIKAV